MPLMIEPIPLDKVSGIWLDNGHWFDVRVGSAQIVSAYIEGTEGSQFNNLELGYLIRFQSPYVSGHGTNDAWKLVHVEHSRISAWERADG